MNQSEIPTQFAPGPREWQPIDTAPKVDHFKCIVYTALRQIYTARFSTFCDAFYIDSESGGPYTLSATHWMPLPEPPDA